MAAVESAQRDEAAGKSVGQEPGAQEWDAPRSAFQARAGRARGRSAQRPRLRAAPALCKPGAVRSAAQSCAAAGRRGSAVAAAQQALPRPGRSPRERTWRQQEARPPAAAVAALLLPGAVAEPEPQAVERCMWDVESPPARQSSAAPGSRQAARAQPPGASPQEEEPALLLPLASPQPALAQPPGAAAVAAHLPPAACSQWPSAHLQVWKCEKGLSLS